MDRPDGVAPSHVICDELFQKGVEAMNIPFRHEFAGETPGQAAQGPPKGEIDSQARRRHRVRGQRDMIRLIVEATAEPRRQARYF